MFERISRLAESVAATAGVSRRGFLGGLGRGGLAAAGVLGALLLGSTPAHAHGIACWACTWECSDGALLVASSFGAPCPTSLYGCPLVHKHRIHCS
jgi:hypothetical protein